MVDEVRVVRLLRSASDSLVALAQERDATATRRADPMWLPGVKYFMITMIESSIDIAQHICSTEKQHTPKDNGDAMRMLGEHGVLEAATADAMRRAVGFRNVLVHEYVEVDDHVVLQRLNDLSDVEAFVAQVGAWLSARAS